MTEQEFLKRYTYNPATDSLGHGGFGDVFRAYDNYLDRYVAIKVAQVRGGIEMLRLRNEVDKASKLLHPNVAHYEECHTMLYPTGEFDFAVMQYYEDGSLDKLFGSDALTREASYDILTQILEGLAYLHSEGIIHRDLKPQNVLIARRGNRYIPKITDFGISKQLDEGQSSAVSNSVLGGTRAYASPEQLKERTIRKNTDLWSFGVIAYQMLVGALPFNCGGFSPTSEEGRQEQFRQMMSGLLPEALNDVPEPWQRLIRECLTVENEKRIAHAEDCLAIIHGEEAAAVAIEVDNPATQLDGDREKAVEIKPQPEPKSVSASKPTEPKRSKWWLWLLLLIVAVGGGIFIFNKSHVAPTGNHNGYEWVDLGLPSGLKWATCNVGANSPEEYGNYYAWGEIRTKHSYSEGNCSTWEQNIGDIAGTNRDAARRNWGGSWRMPTIAEFGELIDNCTWTWTTQNGYDGWRLTGPNGNSIFLPAAGYRDGSSSIDVSYNGEYWSSMPIESDTQSACYFYFDNGCHYMSWGSRYSGRSVRPVLD